eukprot:scaffold4271_cov96-Cylindrotheca_fusiformis.AAC.6
MQIERDGQQCTREPHDDAPRHYNPTPNATRLARATELLGIRSSLSVRCGWPKGCHQQGLILDKILASEGTFRLDEVSFKFAIEACGQVSIDGNFQRL